MLRPADGITDRRGFIWTRCCNERVCDFLKKYRRDAANLFDHLRRVARENLGSTWITVAPRSLAFMTQRKPTGCASAIDEPSIKMQSALARSCCAVVAPPRPKEVPRPGTVLLCHIRAWLDTQTMPRPPVKSFLMR